MSCLSEKTYNNPHSPRFLDTVQADTQVMEICYEQRAVSESVKLTKSAKILGLANHPINEKSFVTFTTDGRLIFSELLPTPSDSSVSLMRHKHASYLCHKLVVVLT